MKVGFTGTQRGMTAEQLRTVEKLLEALKPKEMHHGDCIGADSQFHSVQVKALRVIHPPDVPKKRAFCSGELRAEKPYLERNRDIVNETDCMIATPSGRTEMVRSGTWATIRYARKVSKPLTIVYPDGQMESK